MLNNSVKAFVNYIRENVQDDALAYDEIMSLTEVDGAAFIPDLNIRYDIDLNIFGTAAEICGLATQFADNH